MLAVVAVSTTVAALVVHRRLDPLRLKVLAGLGLTVMVAVAVVMPGRLLVAERLKREEPLTRPYAELAAQLHEVVPAGSLTIGGWLCDTLTAPAICR